MRKELTVYISTNEENEEVKVMRVKDDPQFYLLTLGQNRMVVNVAELMDAIGAIDHYSALFDQEQAMREARAAAPPSRTVSLDVKPIKPSKKPTKVNAEDEGALILEAQIRQGPTASELALEKMTQHMQGETIIVTEKK